MNTKTMLKGLVLGVCFVAYSFSAMANDTITFKWQWQSQVDTVPKIVYVKAPSEKNFTVTWGDGTIQSYQGNDGTMITLSHTYGSNTTFTVTIAATTSDCFLAYFACQNMRITELDVSKCPSLSELYCSFNQIKDLDVSKYSGLYLLNCSFNQITNLNLGNLTLSELDCSYNQISDLNVSGCKQIAKLNCSYNHISNLNLTMNVNLNTLNCSSNQISNLNLNPNKKLGFLNCSSNQISHLDLSNNTALYYLHCDTNCLPLSDLYAVSQKIANQNSKILGFQTLPLQTVCIGKSQFKEQNVFNGIYTNYVVTKGGSPAPISDYAINNGTITFNALDNYTITMTNSAIVSDASYPAKVIVNITVREANTDATLSDLIVFAGKLAPNFSSTQYDYTVNVGDDISDMIMIAIPTDLNATISGDTGTLSLKNGANTFVIIVTAEDDVTKQNYTVTVNRGKVGVEELQVTNYELQVYPNPTTGQLKIKNYELKENSIIEIYDIVGKKQESRISEIGQSEIVIDISHLSSGMYFLKVDGKVVKVIKN
jgi:hypothetical protein